jgi:DNA-binding NarL/FixJ family response regulator
VINVLVVDDNDLMRAGLKSCLAAETDIDVVETASDGMRALEIVGTRPIDVVLMDVQMPGLGGLEACQLITKSYPSTQVLMLSAADDLDTVCAALDAGARGYLLKSDGPQHVAASIRLVHSGSSVIGTQITEMLRLRSPARLERAAEARRRDQDTSSS